MPQAAPVTDPTGRYVRKAFLAKGATKQVYKAFDEHEGLEVAWNELDIGTIGDTRKVAHEIQLLSQLRHPNVIRFCAAWLDNDRRCIVFITELMTSGTLSDFIHQTGAMKSHVIAKYGLQILQGLHYLHSQNIIHRDLKCHNIFVNGHKGEVKIGDFGLSVISRAACSVIGTPEFMAPEIYEEHYTNRVDMWSFGMCLLQMFTGKTPYGECENVAQIFKKVTSGVLPQAAVGLKDDQIKDIILQCLKLDPEARPSAEELIGRKLFRDAHVVQQQAQQEQAQQQAQQPAPAGTVSSSAGDGSAAADGSSAAATGGYQTTTTTATTGRARALVSVASQCDEWSPGRTSDGRTTSLVGNHQHDAESGGESLSQRNGAFLLPVDTEDGLLCWLRQGPPQLQVPSARMAVSLGLLSQTSFTAFESKPSSSSRATSEASVWGGGGSPTVSAAVVALASGHGDAVVATSSSGDAEPELRRQGSAALTTDPPIHRGAVSAAPGVATAATTHMDPRSAPAAVRPIAAADDKPPPPPAASTKLGSGLASLDDLEHAFGAAAATAASSSPVSNLRPRSPPPLRSALASMYRVAGSGAAGDGGAEGPLSTGGLPHHVGAVPLAQHFYDTDFSDSYSVSTPRHGSSANPSDPVEGTAVLAVHGTPTSATAPNAAPTPNPNSSTGSNGGTAAPTVAAGWPPSTPLNHAQAAGAAQVTPANYSEEKKRRAQETEQGLLDQLDLLSGGPNVPAMPPTRATDGAGNSTGGPLATPGDSRSGSTLPIAAQQVASSTGSGPPSGGQKVTDAPPPPAGRAATPLAQASAGQEHRTVAPNVDAAVH